MTETRVPPPALVGRPTASASPRARARRWAIALLTAFAVLVVAFAAAYGLLMVAFAWFVSTSFD